MVETNTGNLILHDRALVQWEYQSALAEYWFGGIEARLLSNTHLI